MTGLLAILAASGNLHGLIPPPERSNFTSDEEYEQAYRTWWAAVHCWKPTRNV